MPQQVDKQSANYIKQSETGYFERRAMQNEIIKQYCFLSYKSNEVKNVTAYDFFGRLPVKAVIEPQSQHT